MIPRRKTSKPAHDISHSEAEWKYVIGKLSNEWMFAQIKRSTYKCSRWIQVVIADFHPAGQWRKSTKVWYIYWNRETCLLLAIVTIRTTPPARIGCIHDFSQRDFHPSRSRKVIETYRDKKISVPHILTIEKVYSLTVLKFCSDRNGNMIISTTENPWFVKKHQMTTNYSPTPIVSTGSTEWDILRAEINGTSPSKEKAEMSDIMLSAFSARPIWVMKIRTPSLNAIVGFASHCRKRILCGRTEGRWPWYQNCANNERSATYQRFPDLGNSSAKIESTIEFSI